MRVRVPLSSTGVISPAPRDAWRDVYESDVNALAYQTPAWVDLLCTFGGYEDASRLYELPHGRIAILPMVRRRALGTALWEASFPPAWGVGGLIASGGAREADLVAMFADLQSRRVPRVSLRPNPLTAPLWDRAKGSGAVTVPRLSHALDLAGGFGCVWSKRFAGSARTAVRKAERSGLTVECDTSGTLIPAYYELFENSLERWAAQQHEPKLLARWRGHRRDSAAKLQAMAATLGDRWRLWLAWLDGQPVAGIVVIEGPSASYTRGAMVKELAGPTRANFLLHRLAIESACQAGCRYYHMGESGASTSLAHFKTRFGAQPYPTAEYHVEAFPITSVDQSCRTAVKRVLRFRDVPDVAR
ncbi:MAG: GNAT family N-acetyltransferase [Solirubrobacteraceae bacterium]